MGQFFDGASKQKHRQSLQSGAILDEKRWWKSTQTSGSHERRFSGTLLLRITPYWHSLGLQHRFSRVILCVSKHSILKILVLRRFVSLGGKCGKILLRELRLRLQQTVHCMVGIFMKGKSRWALYCHVSGCNMRVYGPTKIVVEERLKSLFLSLVLKCTMGQISRGASK